ncbi:hypothetical protein X777_03331 [Ooceraea biroi]|uniref:Uncharacterized protein n=1 Tax=Ooceraea biroi TaxID=2015173 RepID=A0A026WN65_OOCBI|nr:hypothetical protein X777_03331 [Ooceraea biroi]
MVSRLAETGKPILSSPSRRPPFVLDPLRPTCSAPPPFPNPDPGEIVFVADGRPHEFHCARLILG